MVDDHHLMPPSFILFVPFFTFIASFILRKKNEFSHAHAKIIIKYKPSKNNSSFIPSSVKGNT